jgi:uncharacterized damage-inducible protein DinB
MTRSEEQVAMMESGHTLSTCFADWAGYSQRLVTIIAPLSAEQLALRVAPNHWTIGMVTQHLIANRVWWFHGWMGEGSPDLLAIAHWDPQYDAEQSPREADELAVGLEVTWRMIEDALSRWTPADLGQRFPPAAFLDAEEQRMMGERTRQWIVWHVLEHEIHHGGELSLALGTHGLDGVYGTM